MDSLKNIIKFIGFFLLLFLIVLLIKIIPEPEHSIRTSYKEWAEKIGLNATENVKVFCYDGDNSITIELEDENGIEGYRELCSVINAHNKFVDENSDYFPDANTNGIYLITTA